MGKILKTAGALYFISNSIISFILGVIVMHSMKDDDYYFIVLIIVLVSIINFGVKFVFLSAFGELFDKNERQIDNKEKLVQLKIDKAKLEMK